MEAIINKEMLLDFLQGNLELMDKYKGASWYNVRLAFYHQAFGAICLFSRGCEEGFLEIEKLWEENWKDQFEDKLYNNNEEGD